MIIKLDNRQIEIRDDQAKAYENTMMMPLNVVANTFVTSHFLEDLDIILSTKTDDEIRFAILTGMKEEMILYGGIFPE